MNQRSARMKKIAAAQEPVTRVLAATMSELKQRAKKSVRAQLGPRYGIHVDQALGVAMGDLLKDRKSTRLNSSH